MQHLLPNSTLQSGKYKILKVLGQGGFGITYLAEQVNTSQKVAIKEFFLKELCGRDEKTHSVITHIDKPTIERFKSKFLKEARTLMSLQHKNIVRVFDCFEENNTAYYVMDYIEGASISDILRQQGKLDEHTAISYIRKVATALQYVHGMNINHLDVKPGNILLRSYDKEIILIDFGTAKHYDTETGGATTMTQAGYSQGYAPIEQYRQGGVSTFSPETDIYSLGATLYKMLTGQTPPEPSILIESGLPTLPSWVSSNAKSAITSAMQISKNNRPHSVKEFINILDGDESTKAIDESTITNTSFTSGTDTSGSTQGSTSNPNTSKSEGTSWGWIALIIIGIVGGFIWYNTGGGMSTQNHKQEYVDDLSEAIRYADEALSSYYSATNNDELVSESELKNVKINLDQSNDYLHRAWKIVSKDKLDILSAKTKCSKASRVWDDCVFVLYTFTFDKGFCLSSDASKGKDLKAKIKEYKNWLIYAKNDNWQ